MLGGALRDRARVIRTQTTPVRVEGGYQKREVPGPWFRAFYEPGTESESRGVSGVRRREAGSQLVTARRALDGSTIEILATDAVEINSTVHGSFRMDVDGEPERLAKRRTTIGWLVSLTKTRRDASG